MLLGVERFIAEFWRLTPRVLGWMSAAQIFSIVAFIIGIALIFWMRAHASALAMETVATADAVDTSHGRTRRRKRRQ